MCRIVRIERFLGRWPDAEFGPAHIVLGDANVEDTHLDSSVALIDAILDRSRIPVGLTARDLKMLDDLSWYEDHERQELAATRDFLLAYRVLPEDERGVEPGDMRCPDDGEGVLSEPS